MQILREIKALRQSISALREGGARVALVPTMGALHLGHMALVEAARERADHVVASIFVNPKQFGPQEDLDTYPRQEAQDAAMLSDHGVTLLWAPAVAEMYPAGFATTISVSGVSGELCGAARPGHFDGVATVVCKLLNQVQPDVALFGEKDYQQLAVIRRFVCDLDVPVEIVGVPTQRAADGLALSSRNAYMSTAERIAAAGLPRVLRDTTDRMMAGEDVAKSLSAGIADLLAHGFASVDYLELRDADTLESLHRLDRPARLLVAARMGMTRLIDNIAANPRL